jgi:amino acid adenylation domain-containing protein/non-ribosomal peptide synthase protein (TIGR01720 family)
VSVEWPGPPPEAPAAADFLGRWEALAVEHPDRVAVVSAGEAWTYGCIDHAALGVSRRLRSLGLGPESVVGLFIERSPELIQAILGVLKAGGAYLPLDPEQPDGRQEAMADDAGVRAVIVAAHAPRTPAGRFEIPGRSVLRLTRSRRTARAPEAAARAPEAGAGQLAYVIYTSGSTGRPKGVMVSRGSLSWYAENARRRYGIGPQDRVLQFSSIGFDISVEEIFPTLAAGATLVLRDEAMGRDPAAFSAGCRERRVTVLCLPTAWWHELATCWAEGPAELPDSLRVVAVGGERLLPRPVAGWLGVTDGRIPLLNTYGPTEATVVATQQEIVGRRNAGESSIGRPVEDAAAFVLGPGGRPVPVAVAGELCLAGPGVARGYLGRPRETAERFVPRSAGGTAGERIYRTGDLARFRPDGRLDFLGRLDRQVKVRGFRIELGEVESVLRNHPRVRDAVVDARESAPGARRLTAYAVPAGAGAAAPEELRAYLSRELPAYMVPAHVVLLERLPLTPHGKVDRRALPEPEGLARERPPAELPGSRTEKVLARIWERVLGLESAGLRDNFFEAGGDSILSLQVVSRARDAGLLITPQQVFECATLADLAAAARPLRGGAEEAPVEGWVPLTPIQRWFFEQRLPDPHHWNQALMLASAEPLDPARLSSTVRGMVSRHEALRMRFGRPDGSWYQRAVPAGELEPFARVDLSGLPAESPELRSGVIEDAAAQFQTSFHPERGRVFGAVLFEGGAGEQDRLLLAAHHLAVDGVSWRILLEDLQGAYEGLVRGGPARPLGPAGTPYSRWAAALEAFERSPEARSELPFWRRLAEVAVEPLPVDREAGPDLAASARSVAVELGAEETEGLLREVQRGRRVRVDALLLAALALAVRSWAGERPLLVAMEGHGREAIDDDFDLSRTVGWCTSLFPVLLDVGAAEPARALERVEEQLGAVPRSGLGFGVLRYLSADPEVREVMERIPDPEVGFNYLGRLDGTLRRPEDGPSGGSALRAAAESCGRLQSPRAERSHLLELTAQIVGGRLRAVLTYSENRHERATVERLAQELLKRLRQLLEHYRAAGAETAVQDFPLAAIDRTGLARIGDPALEDLYPVSPMQEGMLLSSAVSPGSGTYFEQLSCLLRGALDPDGFEEAWRRTVDRHPALRTSFVLDGVERPLQRVHRQVEAPWRREEWRSVPAAARSERIDDLLSADRDRPFDLGTAPLIRFTLIRLAEEEWFFLWSHHHAILDGWSLPLILQDVFGYYRAVVEGRELEMPPPPPYRDYVAWLQEQDPAEAEAFWRARLAALAAPTPVTCERPVRDLGAERSRREEELRLGADESRALQELGRRQRVTLGTLIHGAWALLLGHYGGTRAPVFGTVVSGRPPELPGADRMVGLMINTLPVRARIDRDMPVGAWLRRLQEELSEQRRYGHCSLAEIQSWSGVGAATPLFESIVVFENYPRSRIPVEEGSLGISAARAFEDTGYPLTLAAAPGREISFQLEYDGARFEATTARRMLGHLRCLLAGLARTGRPDPPLGSLEPVMPAERHQVLVEWNDTRRELPAGDVASLFSGRAAATPDAVALVCGPATLTYGELDRRSIVLAHHLRSLGVARGQLVGVGLERSAELVIALLAVVRAGAAYVALDAANPRSRLAFLMADTGVQVVVTAAYSKNPLPVPEGVRTVRLDHLARPARAGGRTEAGHASPGEPPAVALAPEDRVYVSYTSGSTGRPKGVEICHRGVVRLLFGGGHGRFGPDRAQLHLSPVAFDASTVEIWGSLLHGGRCVVLAEPLPTVAALGRALRRERIDTLALTTSLYNSVIEEAPEILTEVDELLVGGEALSVPHVIKARERLPRTRFLACYGPTESTTFTSAFEIPHNLSAELRSVPLGRPIGDTRVRVLDEAGGAAAVSVAGELCIGGDGLARGYLGRPALTAERFVPDPFAPVAGGSSGSRLYRTGDRARWLPGGDLEFLGRLDEQVKIRGFRVEPGEVASTLRGLAGVRDAAVLACRESSGTGSLIGYVVAEPRARLDVESLRRALGDRLPEYMVPAQMVMLDQLPLAPTGKLDRARLPDPGTAPGPVRADRRPRSPEQEVIAALWVEVLELDLPAHAVDVEADFFTLGGHSLRAMKLVSRIRRAFGVDLELRELFDAPTVAELAERVLETRRRVDGGEVPPLERVPRDGSLVLSFAQHRLWFLDRLDPGRSLYNIPARVRLRGSLDPAALERALRVVEARHEMLRTRFRAAGDGSAEQVVEAQSARRLAIVDLRGPNASARLELGRISALEARKPFDLGRGPLWRTVLLRVAEDDHVLLVTMHHVISDGWSMGVLLRELSAAYPACAAGREPELPELPVQYADYAAWQRRWLRGTVLERQLAYWRERLGGELPTLALPTDRPRPAILSGRGAERVARLDARTGEALARLGRREGATLFMVLLAGFQALLMRLTGQDDVPVGTPVANRGHREVEDLIGLFVNTLVLRGGLSGDPTFGDLVARTRETSLGAYAHQDVPFERVVDAVRPERDLSRTPLFQVMFALQNAPSGGFGTEGLALEPMGGGAGSETFDLSLTVEETPRGAIAVMGYPIDLFDGTTVERFLRRLTALWTEAAEHPERRLAELGGPFSAERLQLTREWNDSARRPRRRMVLHELFEEQAALRPESVALVEGRACYTYRWLDSRADRLAGRLRENGVGPEDRVAVELGRSVGQVAGLLGILKAGAAFVPVDPSYPRARRALVMDDAVVSAVLAGEGSRSGVPTADVAVIDVDAVLTGAEAQASQPPVRVEPEALAYVIYTSGSTGRPKGVMGSHRGMANRLLWAEEHYPLGPNDRVLQTASPGFDVALWECLGPLAAGARLILAPEGWEREPGRLVEKAAAEGVTVAHFVPSILRWVLDQEAFPAWRSLRYLLTGGDRVSRELAVLAARGVRAAQIHNQYGPTEASLNATVWAWSHPDDVPRSSVPVGRPLGNCRMYVLDRELRPTPLGAFGEICLGGWCVTRGYWSHPSLTGASFVPDPFGDEPGSRLYRTGDLGRLVPDGRLEFSGRSDQQVKVRGHRIELGEVEAALRRCPGVAEAVALAVAGPDGESRLVGYVERSGDAALDGEELRRRVGEWLPAAVVPAAVVVLDELPLTAHGKVDRRRLPAPETAVPKGAGEAPRGRTQETLARIWSEVLGIERVGAHDNFFELGGDSILSLQIVSRARRVGLELTAKQVFQHQTVAEQAEVVVAAADREDEGPLIGLVPLTPAQARFLDREPVDPHHMNQALLLELRRPVEGALLERAVRELAVHHDGLRARFHRRNGEWRQVWAAPEEQAGIFGRIDGSAVPPDAGTGWIEALAASVQRSLDLERGPLLAAVYVDLGRARSGRLLLVIHHLLVDGVSWRILLGDLEQLYDALERGGRADLGARTTSVRRWAELLRQGPVAEGFDASAATWRERLAPEGAAFPVDGSREDNLVAGQREVRSSLTRQTTRVLLQDVPSAYGVRIQEVLLTALALTLTEWTGHRRVRIDLEGHGRDELLEGLDLSRTVGWFTAIYPVVLEVRPGAPGSALAAVKEEVRSVPDQGIGYGVLRWLRGTLDHEPGRDAEVSFNYLGQLDRVLGESSAFGPARESVGPSESPRAVRSYLLEVTASVQGERLHLSWHYGEGVHRTATVERLSARFTELLAELIEHCARADTAGYSPSDFPLANLDRETLDRLLAGRNGVEDLYPLSPMQQGILFQSLANPGSVEYFNQLHCRLNGPLDPELLRAAWQRLVDRHTIFRTEFHWTGLERPLQAVRRSIEVPWREEDWRDLPGKEQEERLERFLEEDRRRGFDLSQAPLMRLLVFRIADDGWLFVWNHHHLLLDGWSLPLLFREMFETYGALERRAEPEMALPRPYRDYIAWLERQDPEAAAGFWRRYLAGFTTPVRLGVDRGPEAESGERRYAASRILLPLEATAELERFARVRRVTVNTLVQAAWALLLAYHGDRDDVVYGTVVSGRPPELEGMESMIGPFINAVPVRARLRPEAGVLEWLRELQRDHTEVRQHGYGSLSDVQRWSQVPGGQPLFESSIAFDNYPLTGSEADGAPEVTIEEGRYVDWNSYPVSVDVAPGEQLSISVKYNCARFEPAAVSRILRGFEILLPELAAAPDATLARLLAHLEDEDRRQKASEAQDYQESVREKLKTIRERRRVPSGIGGRTG